MLPLPQSQSTYGLSLLVFNCSKIFKLYITHIGIKLNFYLKPRIFLWLEGRMMLTIIDVTRIFTRGENVEVVYFLNL